MSVILDPHAWLEAEICDAIGLAVLRTEVRSQLEQGDPQFNAYFGKIFPRGVAHMDQVELCRAIELCQRVNGAAE